MNEINDEWNSVDTLGAAMQMRVKVTHMQIRYNTILPFMHI